MATRACFLADMGTTGNSLGATRALPFFAVICYSDSLEVMCYSDSLNPRVTTSHAVPSGIPLLPFASFSWSGDRYVQNTAAQSDCSQRAVAHHQIHL